MLYFSKKVLQEFINTLILRYPRNCPCGLQHGETQEAEDQLQVHPGRRLG